MTDHDDSPGGLLRLRRGAHGFLRQNAALAWMYRHGGDRWEILLPPDTAALPEHQRYAVHTRQEALRLAVAQLLAPDSGRREGKDRMGRTARIVEHFGVCLRPGIQIQRLDEQLVQGPGVKPKFAGIVRQREDGICR